jgi:GntR family transcriptional regulator
MGTSTDGDIGESKSGGVSAYQALATELRAAIRSGEFPPHRRLPTEAELAKSHCVSRQTVRQAYAQLVSESLVYRVRGRGTFATQLSRRGAYLRSHGSVDELLALSIDTELEVLQPLERRANVEAAARLELDNNEVMEITFRRLHEGEPFCVTTVDLPLWVGRRISPNRDLFTSGERTSDTIIGLIERERSIPPIAGAQQSITAVAAPEGIAAVIDCAPGEPVLRIDRLYLDREGARVELAVTHANPVRYAYRLELRRG